MAGWLLFILVLVFLSHYFYLLLKNTHHKHRLFYSWVFIALSGSWVNMLLSFPYQAITPMLVFGLYSALLIKGSDAFNTRLIKKNNG